ncbi:MAG: nucleoside-diphosphate sugar epimerase/dehydratase [Mariprofundales bacterium]
MRFTVKLSLRRWLAFSHDLCWIPIAICLAYWMRFNLGTIPSPYPHGMLQILLLSLPVQGGIYWLFGLYRGIWRFASLPDLLRIFKAVALGAIIVMLLIFVWDRLMKVPRSVMLLYPMFLIIGLTAPRLFYRWLKDHRLGIADANSKRALIIGTGSGGDLLVRDMRNDRQYIPIGFLDDNTERQGLEIHGVRVLGTLNELADVIHTLAIDVVLVADTTLAATRLRSLVKTCNDEHVSCRLLPSLPDLAEGRLQIALRPVRIEDLLGRDPIELNDDHIQALIANKVVLVTGAGGSIGSELCRQINLHNPKHLLLLDHSEYNLYSIEREMKILCNNSNSKTHLTALLGDVRNRTRMHGLFATHKPALVFHAAAYKHVPMVEHNPAEGVATNALGSSIIADLAADAGVETFVMVSTDKAVNPTNVMGASKRAAELYCQNRQLHQKQQETGDTRFITTRFGNVLDSQGSVVPLFREQISSGGPITVTHPDIERYFMTIPEAVGLILQAGTMGKGGEIFVLDMGKAIRIVELAEHMIRLSGMQPYEDIDIIFTGLRPGEKLYEELFHEQESLQATNHAKIMLAAARTADWQALQQWLQTLDKACQSGNAQELQSLLQNMIPEYIPDTSLHG